MTLVAGAGVMTLCLAYFGTYLAVHQMVEPAVVSLSLAPTMPLLLDGVTLAYCFLFGIHALVIRRLRPRWLEPLRVHAANGFYVDAVYHRILVTVLRP
jgi:hypothetical protein